MTDLLVRIDEPNLFVQEGEPELLLVVLDPVQTAVLIDPEPEQLVIVVREPELVLLEAPQTELVIVADPPQATLIYEESPAQPDVIVIGGGVSGQVYTSYRHTQEQVASVWVVDHYLGYDPGGVQVSTLNGEMVGMPVVTYNEPGQTLRLSFDQPVAGIARLS